MDWQDVYTMSASEKVQELEEQLGKDLAELQEEIEESEITFAMPTRYRSTIPVPKSIKHYRRERKTIFKRALNVSQAHSTELQSHTLWHEQNNADKCEYTHDSLPLLLHQYFLDRVHQLVVLKHMHMLRWKRFCKSSKVIESLYPPFNARLSDIMTEYYDCVSRCQRLSVAKEAHMAKTEEGVMAIQADDLVIYLRHLICNLHSIKNFTTYLKVLEYIPISHYRTFEAKGSYEELDVEYSKIVMDFYDDPSIAEEMPAEIEPKLDVPLKLLIPAAAIGMKIATPMSPLNTASKVFKSKLKEPPTLNVPKRDNSTGVFQPPTDISSLPVQCNDLAFLKPQLSYLLKIYGIAVDMSTVGSSADEMELYATVCKKFRSVFTRQESMKTFKVYDTTEASQENLGVDTPVYSLKRESNWLPYVTLKPVQDPYQEKKITDLRQNKRYDEILRVKTYYMNCKDMDHVLCCLKQHAVLVRDPPIIQGASLKSHHATLAMWKKIYSYSDKDNDEDGSRNTDSDGGSPRSGTRRSSYNYKNTVQMLGLDDGEHDRDDPESLQGGYLSFLMLRYLRIRDLQRTTLSILNYFRSIERSITINDGGLSLEGTKITRTSSQNHRRSMSSSGTVGGGGGLGSHAYLHNSPIDFKIEETEFMSFTEIENHDDFFTIEDGRVHVQDLRGYYIMYDSAIQDLSNLENNLVLIASHYIEKDKKMRSAMKHKRPLPKVNMQNSDGVDFSLSSYGHQDIDRFSVLLDIWVNETHFLEAKKVLLDCYLEAYHHISDRDEKRAMAQVITNVMHQRPRFDFNDSYFVKIYRAECINLRLQADLVKAVLSKQIDEDRAYIQKINPNNESIHGVPRSVIEKQPIAINMSHAPITIPPRSALKTVYLMEFHPSLAIASRIPAALETIAHEVVHTYKPDSGLDCLLLERKVLDVAIKTWNTSIVPGSMHSLQTQKDIFGDVFIEDPIFISNIAKTLLSDIEAQKISKKEKHLEKFEVMSSLMEVVTTRFRFLNAVFETEVLSKMYQIFSYEMGFEKFHMYMRPIQFEFATARDNSMKKRPIFVNDLTDEDSAQLDRFIPNHLTLALYEVDETHFGRLHFRSKEGILQFLKPGGITGLQLLLKAQIVHKNALLCAVQLGYYCRTDNMDVTAVAKKIVETDTRANKTVSSMTQGSLAQPRRIPTQGRSSITMLRLPQAFVSLQIEKMYDRDIMLNDFMIKKEQYGSALKNPGELEKLKRSLISEFLQRFNTRISQYSLRSQLIAYYKTILQLLSSFPMIRDNYFMMGELNEVKEKTDDVEGLSNSDHKILKLRPRRLLSKDGRHMLNIWFIPHNCEVLGMFKSLPDNQCNLALSYCVKIVGALHDILQYICAHARMGCSNVRGGSKKVTDVSAHWGGTEGIASVLREIQSQLNNLNEPTSCQEVSDYLTLRRDVMFLEFESALRHSMIDTFLSAGHHAAYRAITDKIHNALPSLSNIQSASLCQIYLPVPEPYEAYDPQAVYTFPWRGFLGNNGPFPQKYWHWYLIDYYMQLCMAGLSGNDRQVANGEILGVSLLMEDVLAYSYKTTFLSHLEIYGHKHTFEVDVASPDPTLNVKLDMTGSNLPITNSITGNSPKMSQTSSHSDSKVTSRAGSSSSRSNSGFGTRSQNKVSGSVTQRRVLSRSKDPLDAYRLLKAFLILWKQLEILKQDWGKRKFSVERIDNIYIFREYFKAYRAEVLFPVMQSVARRLGNQDKYDGIASDDNIIAMPEGASEVEVRMRQMGTLLENLEIHMIQEVRKKLSRELGLVVAERSREEEALPTDLWKKPVMKESYTIARPHIAEQFWMELMHDGVMTSTDDSVTFPKAHVMECINALSQRVIERERQNYESYTMYYETMLRTHHTLLYSKEQEIKQTQDLLKQLTHNNLVEVQCQMADHVHDLLMEITALRAKIVEMRDETHKQEQKVKEKVKDEYHELTMNLFNMTFQLKAKFDEFRSDLYEDVLDKINDTRKEAVAGMHKIFEKYGQSDMPVGVSDKMDQADKIRNLERENHLLNIMTLKMKSLSMWKQNQGSLRYTRMINELHEAAVASKKDYVEVKMLADEEVAQLKQQLSAIRKALAEVEMECNNVKQSFEKDMKLRAKHTHIENEKAKTRKHLDQRRKENIVHLVTELNAKDDVLRAVADEQEKTIHMRQLNQTRNKHDVDLVKTQLEHEKHLKQDAYHRVDELQSQVYGYESNQHLNISGRMSPVRTWQLRAQSAVPTSILTKVINASDFNCDHKKLQRPQTVTGRISTSIHTGPIGPPISQYIEPLEKIRKMQLEKYTQYLKTTS